MYQISIIAKKDASSFNPGLIERVVNVDNLMNLATLTTSSHWAPGTFKGFRRQIKECTGTDLLVFDIDEGQTVEDAKKILAPYRHTIVTSKSHQKQKGAAPPCDRFRVIMPLTERITDDATYKTTWHWAKERLLPSADPACKDISRFFYAGNDIISVQEEGETIKIVRSYPKTDAQTNISVTNRENKGQLSKDTMEFLLKLSEPGTQHNRHIKALFDLREQGYDESEALERSRHAFEVNGQEFGNVEEKRIHDVYRNREIRHITRWPVQKKLKSGEFVPDPKAEENYYALFERLGYVPRYNEMDKLVYIGGRPIEDTQFYEICVAARKVGLIASRDVITEYLTTDASKRRFHPVKEAIAAAEGDLTGKDYIQALIDTLEYDIDTESEEAAGAQYKRLDDYIRRWLVGCMAKLYSPGSQNLTLVFYGRQGIGKSRWLSKLAIWEKAFGEGHIEPGNKDHELFHLTKLIFHVPELESVTSKREAGALKDYLTRDYVNVRPAYGRYAISGRSICSFCASVNVEEFLNDWTGNRRFLTIPVKSLNSEHDVDIAKVFAQAKKLYESGERYWLNLEEIKELNDYSKRFIVENPVNYIASLVHPGEDFLTAHEIFDRFDHRATSADYSKLGIALRQRGIKRARQRGSGSGQQRGFMVDRTKLGDKE